MSVVCWRKKTANPKARRFTAKIDWEGGLGLFFVLTLGAVTAAGAERIGGNRLGDAGLFLFGLLVLGSVTATAASTCVDGSAQSGNSENEEEGFDGFHGICWVRFPLFEW